MIDRILLAPYFGVLKLRHFLYDKGLFKSRKADVPTICVGNITVGGTGKTPHTEMIIRMLQENPAGKPAIAVLSRGYKRKSKGFQQVVQGTDAEFFGDEPLQIKNKFPEVTVAVDSNRIEGCDFLCHPEKIQTSKKGRKCRHKELTPPDLIILDDAYQHRALSPSLSILLINYHRPVYGDYLLPIGRLRDLTERMTAADIIIVSKCPSYLMDSDRESWLNQLKISDFNPATRQGTNKAGKKQTVLFSTTGYDSPEPVFPEGDTRYVYSKRAISLTGIADDAPFIRHLKGNYQMVGHLSFADHHQFSASDISAINKTASTNPTAIIMTTEKDSQRLAGIKEIPETLRKRLFRVPIKASFLSDEETAVFSSALNKLL